MNQFKKAEHLSYLEWMKKALKVQNYFFSMSMGLGAMLSVQLADASQQLGISNGIVLIPAQQQSSDLIVSALRVCSRSASNQVPPFGDLSL